MASKNRRWVEGQNGTIQRVRRNHSKRPSRHSCGIERKPDPREQDRLEDQLHEPEPDAAENDEQNPFGYDQVFVFDEFEMYDADGMDWSEFAGDFRGPDPRMADALYDSDFDEDDEPDYRPALMQGRGKLTMAQLYPSEENFRPLRRKLGMTDAHFRGFLASQYVAEAGNRNG